ncbi:MAG: hypothetical protein GF307_11225 [candidate division Zixibacteria bacterium]|nr:hypothetical protein [candidate division Zixibacteria bacterium]
MLNIINVFHVYSNRKSIIDRLK